MKGCPANLSRGEHAAKRQRADCCRLTDSRSRLWRSFIGNNELALELFDNMRYRRIALSSFGASVFHSSKCPIDVSTRLGNDRPDKNSNESFTLRATVPNRRGDDRLEGVARYDFPFHRGMLCPCLELSRIVF